MLQQKRTESRQNQNKDYQREVSLILYIPKLKSSQVSAPMPNAEPLITVDPLEKIAINEDVYWLGVCGLA